MAERRDRHDTHDLERLVAFVDHELDAAELATAIDQVAGCAECAQLAADLRLLAEASLAMATPARPRDFRLTAADAVRLRMPVAEPVAVGTRLVGEMHDSTHDPTLIAASVDDVLTIEQRRTVDDWIATCSDCADLRTDLVAIAAAHRTMPTPARPRDFRLGERDAARLRGGRWRDLLGWIGGSRDGITRPLATGLTTLGLVGVLVSGAPAIWSGSAASASPVIENLSGEDSAKSGPDGDPGDSSVFTGGGDNGAAQASASSSAPSAPFVPGAAAASPNIADNGSSASGRESASDAAELQVQVTPDDQSGERQGAESSRAATPVGLIASLIALIAGLGTFVVRRVTRSLRGT